MAASFNNSSGNQDHENSPLIYLIHSQDNQANELHKILIDNGYRIQIFSESDVFFHSACSTEELDRASAAVMDIAFTDNNEIPASYIGNLESCKKANIPVIVTSNQDTMLARLAALRAGAQHFLSKPVDTAKVIGLLDEIAGHKKTDPYRVLLVDDDSNLLELYDDVLTEEGILVHTLSEPLKTLDTVKSFSPDVVVLDLYMPEINGNEIVTMLRDSGFQLPVLFLSSEPDKSLQLSALENGGDDFLKKPVSAEHLVATVKARAKRSRRSVADYRNLETTLYERNRERLTIDQHSIVSIADKNGNITYVNEKFCSVSGYSVDELIGQNHRIVKSGIHSPDFYQNIWSTITAGNVWQGEICNLKKDGSQYWVESTITPFLDGDGKPYQYVSIRTDITELKQKELALRSILGGTAQVTGDIFFQRTVKGLAESTGMQIAFIAHRNKTDDTMLDTIAFWDTDRISDNFSYPIASTPCERVLRKEKAIYTENVAKLFPEDLWLKENSIVSYIGIPLLSLNGDLLGHLGVMDTKPIRHLNDKMELLKIFVARVASEIERSQAYELLQSNETKYRTLLSNIPGMAYRGYPDWSVEYISNTELLCGYSNDELQSNDTNWLAIIHPDDKHSILEQSQDINQSPSSLIQEYRITHKNGETRWVSDHKRSVFANNEFLGVDGLVFDITEQVNAQKLVIDLKERLRLGQIYANIGTWEWNIQTGDLYWTERIAPLFGYPEGNLETTYDNFLAAVHPDDRQSVIDAVNNSVEHDAPYDIEHRVVWPDGSVHWLLERGAVLRDSDGKPVQMLGVVSDIHDRKLAQKALQESQEKLSGLFKLSPLGIALTDIDGKYIQFNDAFQRICGYPEDELRELDYWTLTPREYQEQEAIQLESLKTTGRYGPYEKAYRQKNGNLIPIRLNGMIIKNENGESHIWSIVEDITDSKMHSIELINAKEEAERANHAKSEFLSSMSHELRTPMNAILGFSQLMDFDDKLSDDHKESVKEINKAGHHLLDLINEVLDLAKIESGKIDLSVEPVAICEVVNESITLIENIADKQDIHVTYSCLDNLAVRADRTRFKQAIINLLSNAVKYNRYGGSVKLDTEKKGNRLRILITDTGMGISEDKYEELFQPFNRLNAENTNIEGTGIGLSITQRIVEMMGGEIGVHSDIGVGSTFWIELPLDEITEHDSAHLSDNNIVQSQRLSASEHKILYIEDNPANLKLVTQILGHRNNIKLFTAHTPKIGIELAASRQPDLILLDINMPELDGYQVLDIFKTNPDLEHVPVIAVTANAMPKDIERGKQAGFTDYVTKPIDVIKFLDIIDGCLLDDNVD